MHRTLWTAAVATTAALVPAAAATAGTVTLDQPCYTPGSPILATGAGFSPATELTLGGTETFPPVITDAAGAFQTQLVAPPTGNRGARPADVVSQTLAVADPANPALNAALDYEVANFAVDRGTARNPKTVRRWYFSGFPTGQPIYGHFRYGGKTRANYRFGVATGACGLLSKRAPGIPGRVRTGTWTLQIDSHRTYSAETTPQLRGQISVYLVQR
jgi:hypothetical protein